MITAPSRGNGKLHIWPRAVASTFTLGSDVSVRVLLYVVGWTLLWSSEQSFIRRNILLSSIFRVQCPGIRELCVAIVSFVWFIANWRHRVVDSNFRRICIAGVEYVAGCWLMMVEVNGTDEIMPEHFWTIISLMPCFFQVVNLLDAR